MNDFLKYEGSVYSYESSDIHSYNMILVGSMHGNELPCSILLMNIIARINRDEVLQKFIKNNFKRLIIIPFINKNGIRNRSRDNAWFGNNQNDAFADYSARQLIMGHIDSIVNTTEFKNNNDAKLVVLDFHNSYCCCDSIVYDPYDDPIRVAFIDRIIYEVTKSQDRAFHKVFAPIKYRNDLETLKYYVNNVIANMPGIGNNKVLGCTIERAGMANSIAQWSFEYIDTNFFIELIKLITKNLRIYNSKFHTNFKEKVNYAISANITANCSGLLEWVVPVGCIIEKDEAICKIRSIDGYDKYRILDEIKAPYKGYVVAHVDTFYVNYGDSFGIFNAAEPLITPT